MCAGVKKERNSEGTAKTFIPVYHCLLILSVRSLLLMFLGSFFIHIIIITIKISDRFQMRLSCTQSLGRCIHSHGLFTTYQRTNQTTFTLSNLSVVRFDLYVKSLVYNTYMYLSEENQCIEPAGFRNGMRLDLQECAEYRITRLAKRIEIGREIEIVSMSTGYL